MAFSVIGFTTQKFRNSTLYMRFKPNVLKSRNMNLDLPLVVAGAPDEVASAADLFPFDVPAAPSSSTELLLAPGGDWSGRWSGRPASESSVSVTPSGFEPRLTRSRTGAPLGMSRSSSSTCRVLYISTISARARNIITATRARIWLSASGCASVGMRTSYKVLSSQHN